MKVQWKLQTFYLKLWKSQQIIWKFQNRNCEFRKIWEIFTSNQKFGKIYWKFYLKIEEISWHEFVVRIWPLHHNFFSNLKENIEMSNLFKEEVKNVMEKNVRTMVKQTKLLKYRVYLRIKNVEMNKIWVWKKFLELSEL